MEITTSVIQDRTFQIGNSMLNIRQLICFCRPCRRCVMSMHAVRTRCYTPRTPDFVTNAPVPPNPPLLQYIAKLSTTTRLYKYKAETQGPERAVSSRWDPTER